MADTTLLWVDDDGDEIVILGEEGERPYLALEQDVRRGADSMTAVVKLPTDYADCVGVLEGLAKALGVTIVVAPEYVPIPCVEVHVMPAHFPEARERGVWTVTGDILDGLNPEEAVEATRLMDDEDHDSINYTVARLIDENLGFGFANVDMDPESSCFFAYPKTEKEAVELADFINSKEWLR